MRWTLFPIRMGFGRFSSREGMLAGNQELDIVEVVTFWWVGVRLGKEQELDIARSQLFLT